MAELVIGVDKLDVSRKLAAFVAESAANAVAAVASDS